MSNKRSFAHRMVRNEQMEKFWERVGRRDGFIPPKSKYLPGRSLSKPRHHLEIVFVPVVEVKK